MNNSESGSTRGYLLGFAVFFSISIVTLWAERFMAHADGPDWTGTLLCTLMIGILVLAFSMLSLQKRWDIGLVALLLILPISGMAEPVVGLGMMLLEVPLALFGVPATSSGFALIGTAHAETATVPHVAMGMGDALKLGALFALSGVVGLLLAKPLEGTLKTEGSGSNRFSES